MRGAILATAAAFAGTAVADIHARRGHEGLHHRGLHNHHSSSAIPEEECGCYTEIVTYWGEPTTIPLSVPTTTSTPVSVPTSTVTSETTSTVESTSYSTITVTATSASPVETSSEVPSETPVETPEAPSTTPVAPVETPSQAPSETPAVTLPTAGVTSFTETGTYTVPATTLTVSDTTTVCGATTTNLPSGTHTYGGVTTIVETATTVTCPYATVKPSGSTVTSVIETTTYVCPSAGTYTIAPTTTYVPTSTVVVYPTPATFTPGTYTNTGTTVTVTRTDETYYCPYTNGNEPTTAPAVPTTTAVPTTAAPSTTTAVPSTSSSTSSATSVPTGTSAQMGMTFTPYEANGDCMAKDKVLEKVGIIKQKGFTHVRVYGTDCHTLEYVGEACKTHGLIMILGINIEGGSGIEGARPQIQDITNWGEWDLVSLIAVGNEAVNSGICTASELASFVSDAASAFSTAGYTGEVTTAEPIDTWLNNGATLCPVVDIVGANLHPFFNAEFSAAEAGTLVSNQIRDLKKVCTGKGVVNLETGWPNAGNANGKAIPGTAEQATAIKALVEKVGTDSVFFSYADDTWKSKFASSDTYGVEQHWGCIDQF